MVESPKILRSLASESAWFLKPWLIPAASCSTTMPAQVRLPWVSRTTPVGPRTER